MQLCNERLKLKIPKRGYKVDIRFEKPICDIGKATANTINIPFLNLILNDCSRVLLIWIYIGYFSGEHFKPNYNQK